jgi:dynamin 1-like protein
MLHIRDCLPEIKSRISSMASEVQTKMLDLGDATDSQDGSKLGSTLLLLIAKFSSAFNDIVDGLKGGDLGGVDNSELYGGARISHIFGDVFGKSVRAMDPFAGLSDSDIRTAITNANGLRPALFVPEISFDLLVRRQIERLEQPGLQCADLVFAEMRRMAYQSEAGDLARFPLLRDRVFEIVNQILRANLQPAQAMVSNLIRIELAYINTSHPDFVGGKAAVAHFTKRLNSMEAAKGLSSPAPAAGLSAHSVQQQQAQAENVAANVYERPVSATYSERSQDSIASGPAPGGGDNPRGFFGLFRPGGSNPGSRVSATLSSRDAAGGLVKLPQVPDKLLLTTALGDREKMETEVIKTLISSYFDIVKKNFMDMVPKTIMHFLVNEFKEGLQNSLVSHLYRDDIMQDLMKESEDVAAKRKALREQADILRHALEIVNEVRDFNTYK